MSSTANVSSHRVWLGAILIFLGLLLLLGSLRVLDFGDLFSTWWPLILIVIGLQRIAFPGASGKGVGTLLLVLGALFLLSNLEVWEWGWLGDWWPIILILLGVWVLFRARGAAKPGVQAADSDRVNAFAILGGVDRRISSKQFRGGEVTAIMGGIDLDLREAQLSEGMHELRVSTIMGGIEIKVPENWNVTVTGTPILGGIEDRTRKSVGTVPTAGNLKINCFALMGGIEVSN